MGNQANRKKGRQRHANGVEEVMQKTREKNMTKEELLTIEEARDILSRKEEIISEASAQKERLEGEIEALRKEKEQVEASYQEKKEQLLSHAEASAILEQKEQLFLQAQQEAERIVKSGETARDALKKQAEKEAAALKENTEAYCREKEAEAKSAAQSFLEKEKKQASQQAKEILTAAREEEQALIAHKEEVAAVRAQVVLDRANAYEEEVHKRAEEYEQQLLAQGRKSAESMISAAQEQMTQEKSRQEEQNQQLLLREQKLRDQEAGLPEQVEKLCEKRLESSKRALDLREARIAEKEAVLQAEREQQDYENRIFTGAKTLQESRVEQLVGERYTSLCNELDAMRQTANELAGKNNELHQSVVKLKMKLQHLKQEKGGDTLVTLQSEKEQLQSALQQYRENGLGPENISEYLGQKQRIDDLLEMVNSLQSKLDTVRHQAALNTGASDELDQFKTRYSSLKELYRELVEELNEKKAISREDRIKPICTPPLLFSEALPEKDPEDLRDERRWLEHIQKQAKLSGITFQDRQLLAYHTCLKIGEWSSMVVLSGVSGTGKSELPKQYAIHGGMQFLSLPVKPDWDSPAALFGYYNAIENKFEATELLRALYQMQKRQNSPWSDGMLMVLLDEMNLAHPEQYLADLLSKFEEARNTEADPMMEIELGAGESPEMLSIGRNVLWTGTMNEDETTKGLSDKVIDRSMLITFPCPKTLYDRGRETLQKPQLTLSHQRWESWKDQALKGDEEGISDALAQRKDFVMQVNEQLSYMGRNLGHRVWQSIQNYILNYPTVIAAQREDPGKLEEAIRIAFSDALAFKMMPKMRGLELQGENEDHLKRIETLILEQAQELLGDFRRAQSMTSGLFQWNSADFMGM